MPGLRDALSTLPDAVFCDLLEGEDASRVVSDVPGATPETLDSSVVTVTLPKETHRGHTSEG